MFSHLVKNKYFKGNLRLCRLNRKLGFQSWPSRAILIRVLFKGKWIFTVSPLSLPHVPNTLFKRTQGQNAALFRVFFASGETASESHEADIVIQGLECQPKHFHMFPKGGRGEKKPVRKTGKASVKWDEKWQFTSPATINTLMAFFAGPLTVIMPVVKSV